MRLDLDDLVRLKALRASSHAQGILTAYLPIDPATALHHGYVPQLMDALSELRDTAPAKDRERIQEESAAILSHVRETYTPQGTGLAVFSCQPAKLLEAFSFQLPMPALARFGPRAFLQPIDALLEDFPATLIALSDHEGARIMSLELGEIVVTQRVKTSVPGRQRQGGWSAFKYQRDHERHIEEHLKRVAAALAEQDAKHPAEWIVVGGTDETTHALSALLSEPLRARLAGSFRAEMFASDADVAERAREVAEQAERRNERDAAERLVDLALAGGRAALGIDETLQTLREGRARSLMIADYALRTPAGEQAVALALNNGIELEVVHDVAEAVLTPYEGFAAALRF